MKFARRIYLFLLLLMPNILTVFMAVDVTISPLKQLAYFAVVLVGLLLPAFLLKARAYFIAEGIFSLFVAPIEIASLYLNKATASTTFLELVYRTHFSEATELLSSLWMVALLLIVLWSVYFYFSFKEPWEWIFSKKIMWCVLGSMPVLLIIGTIVFSTYARRIHHETTLKGILTTTKDLAVYKLYKIHPYDFYLNTLSIIKTHRQLKKYNDNLLSFRFGIEQKTDSLPELYVLVIGETARACSFSLNGYQRLTNPKLQERENLISFPHAYSQANLTQSAVPHILSRIDVTQYQSIYAEKSLVEAFSEAGFTTAWLNNGHNVRYVNRLLPSVDWVWSANKDMTEGEHYDINMLQPFIDSVSCDKKQFVVVHHLGSHWRYDKRYPKEYEQFVPCAGSNFNTNMIRPENKELLVNAYDNSILYTDFFLDTLISCISSLKMPTVVLYLSDHGENLYDDERNLIMHGSYIGTEYEYNIPFILWYSEEYRQLHPTKIAAAEEHRLSRFNSSVVFHSMLSAADIKFSIDSAKDIFSHTFVEQDSLWALTGDEKIVLLTPAD